MLFSESFFISFPFFDNKSCDVAPLEFRMKNKDLKQIFMLRAFELLRDVPSSGGELQQDSSVCRGCMLRCCVSP